MTLLSVQTLRLLFVGFAVLAVALAADTTGAVEKEATGIYCKTNSGSPTHADCEAAAQAMVTDKCYSGSAYGSGCITVSRHGTCEIMMCQDDESDSAESNRKGIQIFQEAVAVANECWDKQTGKTGGYQHYHQPANDCDDTGYNSYINIVVQHI